MSGTFGITVQSRRVNWVLVSSKYYRFNLWENDIGYRECFRKGEDPNVSKPYGENTNCHNRDGEEQ